MKNLNLIDRAFLLKKSSLFNTLDLDLLLTIADRMELRFYREGEMVFQKGQESDKMYLIIQGSIEIHNQVSSHLLLPGEFFGDEAIFNEKPRAYSANVKERVTLLALTRNQLLNIIGECPSVAVTLLQAYTENMGFRKR
ncbi:MAG: cyclic nucleotide-binding domain-containing protein [Chlamydiales bacterium]